MALVLKWSGQIHQFVWVCWFDQVCLHECVPGWVIANWDQVPVAVGLNKLLLDLQCSPLEKLKAWLECIAIEHGLWSHQSFYQILFQNQCTVVWSAQHWKYCINYIASPASGGRVLAITLEQFPLHAGTMTVHIWNLISSREYRIYSIRRRSRLLIAIELNCHRTTNSVGRSS